MGGLFEHVMSTSVTAISRPVWSTKPSGLVALFRDHDLEAGQYRKLTRPRKLETTNLIGLEVPRGRQTRVYLI
jgi:hypothetical protein